VIYATGNANSAQAAKAATATIPIVFYHGSDPVRLGLVASLNRPGGNVTGVTNYAGELVPKRLELLRELVPHGTTIAFLLNPSNARAEADRSDMQGAARSIGQELIIVSASTEKEIDTAFATVRQRGAGALLVTGDAFFYSRRDQLAAQAKLYAIPASYDTREYVEAGGLMSYGDDRLETLRQAGIYVGRILKGEKPSDLPVMQPTRFQLIVNLRTAKTIGMTISETFLVRADEVIE
jgi:putative ABC transport system substrate-binding protein